MRLDNLFTLEGKTALITGASRGLGQEIALCLSQYGASVVLADLNYPEETKALVKKNGGHCIGIQTDVTYEDQVIQMAKTAINEFGKVDVLINNAGITQPGFTKTEDLSVDEWDHVLATNLKGTFLCCKAVGKNMIQHTGGSIVNIASTAGVTGVQRAPAYCASKSGVISLTQTLALEWARYNVRINAVAPHYLETDLTRGVRDSEKVLTAIVKQIPLGRLGKPSEVVGAVLYLSSDASTYTTGSVIPVDGGYLSQ